MDMFLMEATANRKSSRKRYTPQRPIARPWYRLSPSSSHSNCVSSSDSQEQFLDVPFITRREWNRAMTQWPNCINFNSFHSFLVRWKEYKRKEESIRWCKCLTKTTRLEMICLNSIHPQQLMVWNTNWSSNSGRVAPLKPWMNKFQ